MKEDSAPLPPEILERLRAIRLFHYREMKNLRHRSLVNSAYKGLQAELAISYAYNKASNIHLGFVQDLNDLFPIDDTAEKDDYKATHGSGEQP